MFTGSPSAVFATNGDKLVLHRAAVAVEHSWASVLEQPAEA